MMTDAQQLWMFDDEAFGRGWLGSTERHFATARALSQHGWQTTLVVPRRLSGNQPEIEAAFPGEVLRTPFSAGPWPRWFDRRYVVRLWLTPARLLGASRLLDDPARSWAPKVLRWIATDLTGRESPDVVWGVTYGSLTSVVTAHRVSQKFGVPLVLAFHDPVPRPGTVLGSFEERALETAMATAAGIVVTTRSYAEVLAARFPKQAAKINVVYASYRPQSAMAAVESNSPRRTEPVVILYAGTLYPHQRAGVRSLIVGLAQFADRHPEVHRKVLLRLIGGGAGASEAISLAEEAGIREMVSSEGPMTPKDLGEQTLLADCLLVVGGDNSLQIPGKLFRYLPKHKPILAIVRDGEAADVLRGSGLGLVASPDDPAAIADTLERLHNAQTSAATVVQPDLDYIQQFSEESMGRRLAALLNEIISDASDTAVKSVGRNRRG